MGQSQTSWLSLRGCQPHGALCLITLVCLLASVPATEAQSNPALRKLVYKVAPKYPRELRQNEIGGVVRLSISINPNGSVGRVSAIGGNPVLVDAATVAVKQWKYAPADRQTTTEVQLNFIPHQ